MRAAAEDAAVEAAGRAEPGPLRRVRFAKDDGPSRPKTTRHFGVLRGQILLQRI